MVWLDAVEDDGNALYLDRVRCERLRTAQGERLQLSGLLGDGSYEGEVQVTCSACGAEVTFADQWLAPRALAVFFGRVARETVEAALIDSCRQRIRRHPRAQPRPHHKGQREPNRALPPGEWQPPGD